MAAKRRFMEKKRCSKRKRETVNEVVVKDDVRIRLANGLQAMRTRKRVYRQNRNGRNNKGDVEEGVLDGLPS